MKNIKKKYMMENIYPFFLLLILIIMITMINTCSDESSSNNYSDSKELNLPENNNQADQSENNDETMDNLSPYYITENYFVPNEFTIDPPDNWVCVNQTNHFLLESTIPIDFRFPYDYNIFRVSFFQLEDPQQQNCSLHIMYSEMNIPEDTNREFYFKEIITTLFNHGLNSEINIIEYQDQIQIGTNNAIQINGISKINNNEYQTILSFIPKNNHGTYILIIFQPVYTAQSWQGIFAFINTFEFL